MFSCSCGGTVQTETLGVKEMNFTVEHAKAYSLTEKDLADINHLLKQLNPKIKAIRKERVEVVIDENSTLVLARAPDKTIIGMTTLIMYHKLAIGRVGHVEDVVVDILYHQKGIGERLIKEIIDAARYWNLASLRLTSSNKPERAAAHRLYKKMGFKPVETNLFGLTLK